MTDNDIRKALECCKEPASPIVCRRCSLSTTKRCVAKLSENALSLINRQRAEIERLHKEVGYWEAETKEARADIDQAVVEAIKEVAERLKEEQEFFVNGCDDFVGYVAVSRIDNLTKEMAGDSDA